MPKFRVTSSFVGPDGAIVAPGATIADLDRKAAVALVGRGKIEAADKAAEELLEADKPEDERAIVEEEEARHPEADKGRGAAKRGVEILANERRASTKTTAK